MKEIKNIIISQFVNKPFSNESNNFVFSGNVLLTDFIRASVSGGEILSLFDKIRNEPDAKKQKLLKAKLPAYTISARYKKGRRVKENIVKHSGLICIDIDNYDNPHIQSWAELRDKLFFAHSEILCSALSVRGNGLFLIIKLKDANIDNHIIFFESLYYTFKSFNIKIDNICSDVGRLRYLTHDPSLRLRVNPSSFIPLYVPKKPFKKQIFHKKYHRQGNVYDAAMAYAINKWGEFQDGNKHIFIASVTTFLKNAGVPVIERENFVYNNLLDKSQIKTNCINRK